MKCSDTSTMPQKIVVCISSYSEDEKKRMSGMVTALGGLFSENFTSHVTVLVCGVAGTPKYNAAIEAKIPIVKQEWIRESAAKGGFLPLEDYLLPPFQGLKVALSGFERGSDEREEISKKIAKEGGKVLDDGHETPDCIFVLRGDDAKEIYARLKKKVIADSKRVVVIQDWVEACIKSRRFVVGSDYDCNVLFDKTLKPKAKSPPVRSGYVLDETVKELEGLEANDERGLFLSDCVIYCDRLESAEERKMQKRLVTLAGGCYFESFNKAITHVMLNSVRAKNEYKESIDDYSSPPFLVDHHWLRDCIVKRCHMPEASYKPMLSGLTTTPEVIGKKATTKSSAPLLSPFAGVATSSMLFKGVTFRIEEKSYSLERVQEMVSTIERHMGTVVRGSRRTNYTIANDGAVGNVMSSYGRTSQSNVIVSHRWIDYCLKHKSIVNIEKNKQIYLLPMPHASPYEKIEGYVAAFLGLKYEDKLVLGRIFEAMGGKVGKDAGEITHIVTNTQVEAKIKDIVKKRPEVVVVNIEWLLDYMEFGKAPDDAKHRIDVK